MNIVEIDKTITELENGETTFTTCERLACLYVVKEHLATDDTTKELNEILPSYNKYRELKTEYQMGLLSQEPINIAIQSVCKEISEFLDTLFYNTDTPSERKIIELTLSANLDRMQKDL